MPLAHKQVSHRQAARGVPDEIRGVHVHGDYLIGRAVAFEDRVFSEKRRWLAVRNNAGLG